MITVEKRDGTLEPFSIDVVKDAILKVVRRIGGNDTIRAQALAIEVFSLLDSTKDKTVGVDDIHDTIEKVLVEHGHARTAKEYIISREYRERIRRAGEGLMDEVEKLTFQDASESDSKRENANINTDTSMGVMLKYGTETAKRFNLINLMTNDIARAHVIGDIHAHDLDFYGLTMTCCQIPMNKLFEGGFSTGHGHLREPSRIGSYSALACIALQSNQNDMHGGQSIPMLDYYLAPGVAKSMVANLVSVLSIRDKSNVSEIKADLKQYLKNTENKVLNEEGKKYFFKKARELCGCSDDETSNIWDKAYMMTNRDTHQAMEAMIHNFNSMHSRAGSQVPFSSVNLGTDISEEGRMVTRNFLTATEEGLGNGEVAIFPISIFKVKEGINYNEGDPNYDLFKQSLVCSARRMFPNHSFLDSPYNLQYYVEGRPETEVAYMGCVASYEVITYKIDGVVYVEGIGRAYKRIADKLGVDNYGVSEYVNTEGKGISVYDSNAKDFVEVKKFICNPDKKNWKQLKLSNGRALTATDDHPLPIVGKGRTFVKDMVVGDKVYVLKKFDDVNYVSDVEHAEITSIESIDVNDFSYDLETASDRFDVSGVLSHNCRTRVIANVYDPSQQVVTGRGNLSFTTINLPRIAIEAGRDNLDRFYEILNERMMLTIRQLRDRFRIQYGKKVYNFPFLMGEGVWLDSDKLGYMDTLGDVIKHGTLSVGFIGLAETLKVLVGEHHGESEDAQQLGLEIIEYMREILDDISAREKMNYTLLATPAEGLSGRFIRLDRANYGEIEGVTDKEFYTNSFHLPVDFNVDAFTKIKIEAPYHALTNAGHITYVEMDGDPTDNIDAFEAIIRCMKENGIGYGAINHPLDRDPICGYTGIIKDMCPRCGRREGEGLSEEKLEELRKKYKDLPTHC